jgi:hypothetical protein
MKALLAACLAYLLGLSAPGQIVVAPNTPRNNAVFIVAYSLSSIGSDQRPAPDNGPNTSWTQVLEKQSNYVFHGPWYNLARGGQTASNWFNSWYATDVQPKVTNWWAAGGIGIVELGYVDVGQSLPENYVTNCLRWILMALNSNSVTPVCMSVSTNANWTLAQLTLMTNINLDMSNQCRAFGFPWVDVNKCITNGNQFNADGNHWTSAAMTNVGTWFATQYNPSFSGQHSLDYPVSEWTGPTRFGGLATFDQSIAITGDPMVSPPAHTGYWIWIYQYNGTLNNAGAVLQAYNSDGAASGPLNIMGSPLYLRGGVGNGTMLMLAGNNALAQVGGTIYVNPVPIVNAGTAATNLYTNNILANTLINQADSIELVSSGTFSLTGQSKELQLMYGTQTAFDTGLQPISNGFWQIRATITKTGPTNEYALINYTASGASTNWSTNFTAMLIMTNARNEYAAAHRGHRRCDELHYQRTAVAAGVAVNVTLWTRRTSCPRSPPPTPPPCCRWWCWGSPRGRSNRWLTSKRAWPAWTRNSRTCPATSAARWRKPRRNTELCLASTEFLNRRPL